MKAKVEEIKEKAAVIKEEDKKKVYIEVDPLLYMQQEKIHLWMKCLQ